VTLLQLLVKIGADTSQLQRELATSDAKIEAWGDKLKGWGTKLTVGLTAPLALVGGAAVKLGMDAVESENLVSVSFGRMADSARAWSQKLSDSLGLNEFELRRTAGTFYTMFEAMGLGEQASYDMATGLSQLAHDMASFYNLDPAEAFEKLRAGIMGETEPLKTLGILVDENTTKTYAYKSGLKAVGAELSQQEKVLARFGAIMQQTGKAQGDLARTIDSPSNQLRIFKSRITEAGTELGLALLPAVSAVIGAMNALVPYVKGAVEWFAKLSPTTQSTIVVLLGIAAASGPVLMALGQLASMYATVGVAAARLIAPVVAANVSMTGSGTAATVGATGVSRLAMAFGTLGVAIAAVGGAVGGFKLFEWLDTGTDKAVLGVYKLARAFDFGDKSEHVAKRIAEIEAAQEKARRANGGYRRKGGIRSSGRVQASPTDQLQQSAEAAAKSIEEKLRAAMKGLGDDTTKAAKEAKKSAEEFQKFADAASGKDKIDDAQRWIKLLSQGGKVTREEHEKARDAMLAAIRVLEETDQTSSRVYRDMVASYRVTAQEIGTITARDLKLDPTKMTANWRPEVLKNLILEPFRDVTNGIGDLWKHIPKLVDPATAYMAEKLGAMRAMFRDAMGDIRASAIDGFAGAIVGMNSFGDAFRGIFQSLQKFAKGIFDELLSGLMEGIAGLFSGKGGSGFGGLKDSFSALGQNKWMGAGASALIGGTVGYGVGSRYGTVAGVAAGAGAGALAGTAIAPGVGTVIGAGVGALAGWIGGRKKSKEQKKLMEEDRVKLLEQFGGMEKLRETAKGLGVDIDKAFSTKKPEEFGRIVGELQDKLDAQKKRWEGIDSAVAGVNARSEAFVSALTKAAQPLEATRKTIADLTAKRGGLDLESGSGRDEAARLDAMIDAQRQQEEAQRAAIGGNAALAGSFNWIGAAATAALGAAIKETGDAVAAYRSVMPAIEQLRQAQATYGFEASAVTQRLMDNGGLISAYEAEFSAVSANLQIWKGLGDAQAQSRDMAILFGQDSAAQFEAIVAGGGDATRTLALMQPTIQALWEAEQKFGKFTDESTRKLIDQGVQAGLVGAQQQSVNQKILDVLIAIGDAFGARIPNGIRNTIAAGAVMDRTLRGSLSDIQRDAYKTADEIETAFEEMEIPAIHVPIEYDTPAGLPDSNYSGGNTTVNVNVDGYPVAQAVAPHLPGVFDFNGV
jgi:hypothetical protein